MTRKQVLQKLQKTKIRYVKPSPMDMIASLGGGASSILKKDHEALKGAGGHVDEIKNTITIRGNLSPEVFEKTLHHEFLHLFLHYSGVSIKAVTREYNRAPEGEKWRYSIHHQVLCPMDLCLAD